MDTISREDLLGVLNASGLASKMSLLKSTCIDKVVASLVNAANVDGLNDERSKSDLDKHRDRMMLNSVGPAAAATAVDYAIRTCRSKGGLKNVNLNGSFVHNVELIQNDVGDNENFSNVLRQFLLPRYAFLNFDSMVDPRHQVDSECGYPKFISPSMYRYMYDRDDMARRVNDIYPDESWGVDPKVWDDEDEENETPFELSWKYLCQDNNLLSFLYRADRLCGVGHYGVLLLGTNDGSDLEKPIQEADLLAGKKRSVSKKQRELLYMRPFDEYLSFISEYDRDTNSPRYGLPVYYNLIFLDMAIDAAGASVGTRLMRRVHWSRVIHIADNLGSSNVMGLPRQQPVFNRLLDLRKIKGSSAEMFWKGGFPGISFEINPEFVADNPEFDREKFKEEIEKYSNGLQRYLQLIGISAKSLAPTVASPKDQVMVQVQAIASHFGIPLRIFMGSEESRLASSQDKQTWNQRLKRRLGLFVEPFIIRAVVDRFVAIGIMPPPQNGRYMVGWNDLNAPTDEDKANLSLKWTQALSQYVSSGIIHLIPPMDYMTTVMGLPPSTSKKIISQVENKGGWAMLMKVDPSTGSGMNGKRQNTTKKDSNKERGSRKKRDTSQKRIEGNG